MQNQGGDDIQGKGIPLRRRRGRLLATSSAENPQTEPSSAETQGVRYGVGRGGRPRGGGRGNCHGGNMSRRRSDR
jgi:hypothetical protein